VECGGGRRATKSYWWEHREDDDPPIRKERLPIVKGKKDAGYAVIKRPGYDKSGMHSSASLGTYVIGKRQ